MKENPRKTKNEGVKATAQKSINMFKEQLNQKLLTLSATDSDDLQMVYLDKNFPPTDVNITLHFINEHAANQKAKIRRVALVPDVASESRDFPFSTNFFVQSYIRCLERKGHLTMANDNPERLIKLLVLFFQQFKGARFDESFKDQYGFDDIIKFGFTLEHQDLELPPKLEKLLRQALNTSDLSQAESHFREICRLISLYRGLFSGTSQSTAIGEEDHAQTSGLRESLAGFVTEFREEKRQ